MEQTLIESPPRITIRANRHDDIQNYGEKNVYPQVIRNAFKASGRAMQCIRVFEKFVTGKGLPDPFYKTVVNPMGETIDKVRRKIVRNYCRFYGFALHFNYNLNYKIASIDCIPFEEFRLGLENDDGFVPFVKHHRDWGKEISTRFDRSKITAYHMFNPDPDVVRRQIEDAAGIENYKGQVFWWSINGPFKYPEASCDPVLEDVLADTAAKETRLNNIESNFLVPTIIETPKYENKDDLEAFQNNLNNMVGGKRSGALIHIQKTTEESSVEIKKLEVISRDGIFEKTENSSKDAIRGNYMQPPVLANDLIAGKMGTSDEMAQAYHSYNAVTSDDRLIIDEVITEIFKYWKDPNVFPATGIDTMPLTFALPAQPAPAAPAPAPTPGP